ncbi:MAG: hypothetical protein FJ267_17230 [Planctomycetes bacterium]|nr:hypothetical protein [Planctomycetota bacterium]
MTEKWRSNNPLFPFVMYFQGLLTAIFERLPIRKQNLHHIFSSFIFSSKPTHQPEPDNTWSKRPPTQKLNAVTIVS